MKKAYIVTVAACAAILMSGCSTIKGKGQADRNTNAGTGTAQTVKNNMKTDELSKAIGGEWAVTAAGSTTIQRDEDMPYLCFVPEEHRFYGSNGCNVLNGDYSLNGGKVTFNNVLATMKYCPGLDFEQKINEVVRDGNTVTASVKKLAGETILSFSDSQGRSVLTLTRHNMGFLNGYWLVTSIYGKSVSDEEANIFFDINERKVHGNTGCNYFNGTIYIDPSIPNHISFSGMGVTRMACPKADQERNMLVALEETSVAISGNDGNAILMDANGKQVLTLKRGKLPETGEQ